VYKLYQTLLALHNAGVCHNDLKPRHVVVGDDDGSVNIVDLGWRKWACVLWRSAVWGAEGHCGVAWGELEWG